MEIKTILKQMRVRRGLSMQELADLIEKAAPPDKKPSAHKKQHLSNLENGASSPNWDTIAPIFTALGYRLAFVDLQPDWVATKDLEAIIIKEEDDAIPKL